MTETIAKPFVKWVGGKTQLLEEVKKSLPKNLKSQAGVTYVEPFVGGGAVMFWILQEYPNIERAIINDINAELICTYRVVKQDVLSLVEELERIQSEYISLDSNSRKEYYIAKRKTFNSRNISDIETAALFIFLNRTCFNGLYRVNSKGEFNVPHGKYANPRICDRDNLLAASKVLQKVEILCGDFTQTEQYAGPDTIFYFDPPYKPITETSSFTSYAKDGFNDEDQIRLRDFCIRISKHKAQFVASNSDPKENNKTDTFFDNIYCQFTIKRVSAARMINSNPDGRGAISEIMISNIVNA
ncbi:MAG: DNA adenine methylase [Candidatus Cryptobacteroides sp.]